jgi:hypothetical protein
VFVGGVWICPEAGDEEVGVESDWRERRDLGGSHGRMLIAGAAPAPEQARSVLLCNWLVAHLL